MRRSLRSTEEVSLSVYCNFYRETLTSKKVLTLFQVNTVLHPRGPAFTERIYFFDLHPRPPVFQLSRCAKLEEKEVETWSDNCLR